VSEDKPAVEQIRRLIATFFEAVEWHWVAHYNVTHPTKRRLRDHRLHGVGGYNNRKTKKGGPSAHAEGRAADIYVDASNGFLKSFGDALFTKITAHADELGVDHVIWNHQIWSTEKPTVRSWDDDPHEDHMHLAFTRAGALKEWPSMEDIVEEAATETKRAHGILD